MIHQHRLHHLPSFLYYILVTVCSLLITTTAAAAGASLPTTITKDEEVSTCNSTTNNNNNMSFFAKLEARVEAVNSLLCIGLDPHLKELFPDGDSSLLTEEEKCNAAYTFCKTIIDATGESASLPVCNA